MSKDDEIAALQKQVKELQSERVKLLNYILKLDRELQTGETNGTRNNTTRNQRQEDPAG